MDTTQTDAPPEAQESGPADATHRPEAGGGGWRTVAADFAADVRTIPMSWGKAMMWIFIVADAFIFAAFLVGYGAARAAAVDPWPDPAEIFALSIFGAEVPLLLIAIMTFILISSSGTMALAVNFAYQGDKQKAFLLVLATALLGLTFLGMQVYEWFDLIGKGFRPWENPEGAVQFGSAFFMITGFHGLHVTAGVIYLLAVAAKIKRGGYEREGNYEGVEFVGLYWHFVDLVWVFVFAFFYLI